VDHKCRQRRQTASLRRSLERLLPSQDYRRGAPRTIRNRAMAKTRGERENDARNAQLEHMREQIESGELTVRQMTDAEQADWDERSAASERQATPKERARRDAARKKRAGKRTA
jgi:hypothetical protein